MTIYRSLLFIPANKIKWLEHLDQNITDAVIIDLEDSVPEYEKEQARKNVIHILEKFKDLTTLDIFVRINKDEDVFNKEDLEAVVRAGLTGVVLPKVDGPEEIDDLSKRLSYIEGQKNLDYKNVTILPILETAKSIYSCLDIAKCERVIGITGLSSKNGDVERALGTQWSENGLETLYLKSKIVLAARTANVLAIGGLWQDVHNLEGLTKSALFNRQLGYSGELILHPSNAEIINNIYSPSEEQVTYYQGLIDTFNIAKERGEATIMYDGSHIDLAHVKTAKEVLSLHNMMKN